MSWQNLLERAAHSHGYFTREAKERAMLTTDDIAKLREHRLFRRANL